MAKFLDSVLGGVNRALNYRVQGYAAPQQQMGLLSTALPSPYGDVAGLLADGMGYAADPSSLTPGRGLLSLAAMAPGVPRPPKKVTVWRAQVSGEPLGRWFSADKEIAREFAGLFRADGKKVKLISAKISSDQFDDFWRAAEESRQAIPQEKALLFPEGWESMLPWR